jgi:elongation factor Tu
LAGRPGASGDESVPRCVEIITAKRPALNQLWEPLFCVGSERGCDVRLCAISIQYPQSMFRMTVDGVFAIRGRGTVVAGVVEEGTVRVGDQVSIGDGFSVRVDGIEVSRQVAAQADAGEKAGLLFTDLDKASVMRGQVVTDGGYS